jgi:plasmid maintenance system antidote protein VapI
MKTRGWPYPKDFERRRLVHVDLATRDMTVTDLAEALGVNRGNMCKIINGTRTSRKTEEKIAAYFGKERMELLPARSLWQLLEMRRAQEPGDDGGAA